MPRPRRPTARGRRHPPPRRCEPPGAFRHAGAGVVAHPGRHAPLAFRCWPRRRRARPIYRLPRGR
ncbi:MAG: hypothetical protein FJ309_16500 [Planctomycetes bacterium]|nr:hypothetical protein [Planctomycetota bacterium]MBM4009977.1 hypothetical protein [Planctomycetota bacterium]MBM4058376.1 hypothetical protein [Planctomycetota bacterium]